MHSVRNPRLCMVDLPGEMLAVRFEAMASPCELVLPQANRARALELGERVAEEAWRVERKFSRYRDDSVIGWIHRNRGTVLSVDSETASLLDFAAHCYALTDGRFDVTSGVLRRVWKFDGSDRVPADTEVAQLLPLVGFSKVKWERPYLTLPEGMELDFGGFGKEYAVDRAFEILVREGAAPFLINFGGDLRAEGPPPRGKWYVGIERPDTEKQAAALLELERGALATSGDSYRFVLKNGVRYGHVLNPLTGWPVVGAPRSVTVAGGSCTEAGLLATAALLQGVNAERFLQMQEVRHWVLR